VRAIVIKKYGGPEVLAIEERPRPKPKAGEVLIQVKAFGLNHAEIYFRMGVWGDVAEISGIECVGVVAESGDAQFSPGEKVAALVGGMGRSINGSYAEYTVVPTTNVVALKSNLPWEELAAIPESYATAWTSLVGILGVAKGQVVAVRGATSALGQAAINIAAHAGAHVIATTRNEARIARLQSLGAKEALVESRSCRSRFASVTRRASMRFSTSWATPRFSTRSGCCDATGASVWWDSWEAAARWGSNPCFRFRAAGI